MRWVWALVMSIVAIAIFCLAIIWPAMGWTSPLPEYRSASSMNMAPTVMTGERILLKRVPSDYDFQRGDIVLHHSEVRSSSGVTSSIKQHFLRRIIGMPGDRIAVLEDGTVILNGEALPRTYYGKIKIHHNRYNRLLEYSLYRECSSNDVCYYVADIESSRNVPMEERIVREGNVMLMGDNRDNSLDSREPYVGDYPLKDIQAVGTLHVYSPVRDTFLKKLDFPANLNAGELTVE